MHRNGIYYCRKCIKNNTDMSYNTFQRCGLLLYFTCIDRKNFLLYLVYHIIFLCIYKSSDNKSEGRGGFGYAMIINRFVNSFVFWAAWIIIPVIMEIIPSIGSIVVLIKKKIKPVKYDIPIIYPEISLLIPVYNSHSLEACISSIYESDYPNDKIRIFLVNNQGQDNSFNVFAECQKKFPELMMQWLNAKQGKSKALNLALFNSDGKYIIHIDSDGILEKTALTNMVNKFEADLSIDCMTGAIMTMPDQVEEYKGFFAKLLRKWSLWNMHRHFLQEEIMHLS